MKVSRFSIEDIVTDIYYWFDKSTKRKATLAKYCTFCDTSYKEMVKHVNTRLLSLEKAVGRVLQQYAALQSYCLSEDIVYSTFSILTLYKTISDLYR